MEVKGRALQAEGVEDEVTLTGKLSVIREHKGVMVAGEGEKSKGFELRWAMTAAPGYEGTWYKISF